MVDVECDNGCERGPLVRCPGCGTINPDHAARCGQCDRALRTPTDKVHGLTPPPSSSSLPPGPRAVSLQQPSLVPRGTEGGQPGGDHIDEERFAPGTVVMQHYTIERQLGRGGMGAVYLAVDDVSGQRVAVKVLPAWHARDRELRERFVLEARALAALDHPGIVPLITFAQDGDDRFLVMKYVAGEVLENRVRDRGVLDADDARRILRAMCGALAFAHDKGVVHRDIKPQNVLVDSIGNVVIVDFGIARNNDGARRLTETGMLMGTPQYMSPEQITGRTVDGRADLYACGLVLFEMLTGAPPFEGEQTFDVLRAQMDAPVPDLRAARYERAPDARAVPADLVALCLVLLEKDPERRPDTGHHVVEMIDGKRPVPSASASASAPPSPVTLSTSQPSWALSMSSPRTTQTPALAFSDDGPGGAVDDDDDDLSMAPSQWRAPVLALGVVGDGMAAFFAVTALDVDDPAAVDVAVVDAGPAADQFQQAVLLARARVALERLRLDDARVAVDTALSLASGEHLIEPLLLRAEILVAGHNVVDAAATLNRLPMSLDAVHAQRRDALLEKLRAPPPTKPPPTKPTTKPPKATEPPPKATEPPPKATEPTPKATEPTPKATEPTPKATEPPLPSRPSTLSDADFDAVTRAARPRVSFCYAEHVLSESDGAVGAVTLSVTVANDGTVRRVTVLDTAFTNDAFTACVVQAVGDWHFAPFQGGDDVVRHVFSFKPKTTD